MDETAVTPYSSADELCAGYARGEVTATEVVTSLLDRIDSVNPTLNAIVALRDRRVLLAEAQAADEVGSRNRRPLEGVPILLKDNVETKELRTTFGSTVLHNNQANYNAIVVSRLLDAGAIYLGKTNTPEWMSLPLTDNEAFGPTPTPWDLERTSGGSSGGAAAAVAAGLAPMAQGSDGGGSCRIPASCCGVVGVKPSRGRVPWAPRVHECWNGLAINGPIARTVRDAALMLDVMSGPVLGEPFSIALPRRPFLAACDDPAGPLRVGVLTEAPHGKVDAEVAQAVREAAELLRTLGHQVVDEAPDLSGLEEDFLTVLRVNATVDMQEFGLMSRLSEMSENVRRLAMEGKGVSGPAFARTLRNMGARSAQILQFWARHDVLLTPTVATLPITATASAYIAEVLDFMPFTYQFNMTGQPALSVPYSLSLSGLPIGIQLVGRPGAEETLFALAAQIEAAGPWRQKRPPLFDR